jgi:hypothetical protein
MICFRELSRSEKKKILRFINKEREEGRSRGKEREKEKGRERGRQRERKDNQLKATYE